jgi:hypothetical protein
MLALACSADTITMGEDGAGSAPVPSDSRCADSPQVIGDVAVTNQREMELLEGCEAIEGNLVVIGFPGADLRPLHALRTVSGRLHLAGNPDRGLAPPDVEGAWLESIEGLESLESVGQIHIQGLLAENLDPLASLRELTTGTLSVQTSPNLVDLGGLAQLRGVRELFLSCEALESMDGLVLPEEMRSLRLIGFSSTGAPPSFLGQLRSIGVRSITRDFFVSGSALKNMDAFSDLRWVGTAEILANPALESMDGLSGLTDAGAIEVSGNPNLTRLPDLSKLYDLRALTVGDNERLTALPPLPLESLQLTYVREGLVDERPVEFLSSRPDLIDISGNPALTAITLPAAWVSVAAVKIEGNATLTQLEFTGQRAVDYLSIQNNPALGSLSLGDLATVDRLDLINNPGLAPTVFDSVRTFETNLSSSAPAP